MYHFKVDKYKELLDGRTIEWLSETTLYNRVTLSNILNGNINCKKIIAIAIVLILNRDNNLEDFFEKVE